MSILLRIVVVLVGFILIYVVMKTMKKMKMSAGLSLLWLFSGAVIIILGIFPNIVWWAAGVFDIVWPPAVVLFSAITILGFISYRHAKEISVFRAQITELTEQVSVMKYELQQKDILIKGKLSAYALLSREEDDTEDMP